MLATQYSRGSVQLHCISLGNPTNVLIAGTSLSSSAKCFADESSAYHLLYKENLSRYNRDCIMSAEIILQECFFFSFGQLMRCDNLYALSGFMFLRANLTNERNKGNQRYSGPWTFLWHFCSTPFGMVSKTRPCLNMTLLSFYSFCVWLGLWFLRMNSRGQLWVKAYCTFLQHFTRVGSKVSLILPYPWELLQPAIRTSWGAESQQSLFFVVYFE